MSKYILGVDLMKIWRIFGLAVGIGVACIYAEQAPCQTSNRSPVSASQGPRVKMRGSLGTASKVAVISKGEMVSSSSIFDFQSNEAMEMRFEGFGHLQTSTGAVAPFEMRLVLEVSGLGVMFDGSAPALNSQKVSLPASLASGGIQIKLSRENRAMKNIPAGTYLNEGRITFTKM